MSVPGELLFSGDRKSSMAVEPASIDITVSDETTNVRNVTIQVKDGNGAPMQRKRWLDLVLWATTGQAALSSASTGLAVDTGTISIAAWTAGKALRVLTDANGQAKLTYTDTGTATAAIEAVCGAARALSAQFANT